MWRNIATMIYFWHEQMHRGGAGGEYTLVFATLCSQDTVRIMPYRFSMADETVATRPPWLDSSLPRRPCRCISVYRSIILQTLNSFAIRSQGSTCALAVAAAYVPYVVAKLLQMMLLNYTCLNYASPNLRFAYTGMQACIDDTF